MEKDLQLEVLLSGHIHNRRELVAKLSAGSASPSDTDLLKACWLRWGEDMAQHLVGDFALVVRDETRRVTYLVRNPLGVKPLYYRLHRGRLIHGFSIPELSRREPLPLTRDMDWAAAYMVGLSFSQDRSAYKEICKVPPGHCLLHEDGGRTTMRRYHVWRDDAPLASRRNPDWVDAYRAVLEESIRCRMDPQNPMGTENSGGIDSATITAYLARFLGDPGDRLHSFGFALAEQEPAYILETSQASGIRHNYIATASGGGQCDVVPQTLDAIGHPPEHSNAASHTMFYRECQLRGIRSLFSGFGGDEVVTNSGGHLRYELHHQRHFGLLWDILPGSPAGRVMRLAKLIWTGRQRPTHNNAMLQSRKRSWGHHLLRPDLANRLNLYDRYMEAAVYDAPYERINDFIIRHHLGKMILAARLEHCTLVAAAYGVDYRWPLWDVRLVQQYLSTPSIEKVGPRGIGRYLHRRAIDGIVPHRVAWKPSKDMGYARQMARQESHMHERVVHNMEQLTEDPAPALGSLIDVGSLPRIVQAAVARDDRAALRTLAHDIDRAVWLNCWFKTDALGQ